jgi:hypothetical protein
MPIYAGVWPPFRRRIRLGCKMETREGSDSGTKRLERREGNARDAHKRMEVE